MKNGQKEAKIKRRKFKIGVVFIDQLVPGDEENGVEYKT